VKPGRKLRVGGGGGGGDQSSDSARADHAERLTISFRYISAFKKGFATYSDRNLLASDDP
jgi:hypothetical protein